MHTAFADPESPQAFAAQHSAALVAQLDELIGNIVNEPWPEMQITRKGYLRCPYCRAKNGVRELDYGRRDNDADVELGANPSVYVSQGERDFHTLAFQCTACEGLVRIPAEADVEWHG